MPDKIFGISVEEINRQCLSAAQLTSNTPPLTKFSTIDPCISGGTLILQDEGLTNMLRNIYRGGRVEA